MDPHDYNNLFLLGIIGDEGVGKTTLLESMTDGRLFDHSYGGLFLNIVNVGNKRIRIHTSDYAAKILSRLGGLSNLRL